jgi:hypothetical protein
MNVPMSKGCSLILESGGREENENFGSFDAHLGLAAPVLTWQQAILGNRPSWMLP